MLIFYAVRRLYAFYDAPIEYAHKKAEFLIRLPAFDLPDKYWLLSGAFARETSVTIRNPAQTFCIKTEVRKAKSVSIKRLTESVVWLKKKVNRMSSLWNISENNSQLLLSFESCLMAKMICSSIESLAEKSFNWWVGVLWFFFLLLNFNCISKNEEHMVWVIVKHMDEFCFSRISIRISRILFKSFNLKEEKWIQTFDEASEGYLARKNGDTLSIIFHFISSILVGLAFNMCTHRSTQAHTHPPSISTKWYMYVCRSHPWSISTSEYNIFLRLCIDRIRGNGRTKRHRCSTYFDRLLNFHHSKRSTDSSSSVSFCIQRSGLWNNEKYDKLFEFHSNIEIQCIK